ncbi:hypothetical protein AAF712_007277 [Marasmius tenuissimus]|uniref:Ubiquitin-like domain-containing protein n=1 Tax=Marasmius tenuissimus TaxID=585030 RepID=A0ABR2ZXI2_9AGAR
MPKASTSKKSSLNLLALAPSDGSTRAKLIPRPVSYIDAVNLVRKHFKICRGYDVVLETNELDICDGKMLEITEDVWEVVRDNLGKLYFDERPIDEEIYATVSKNQASTSIAAANSTVQRSRRARTAGSKNAPLEIRVVLKDGQSCTVEAHPSDCVEDIMERLSDPLGSPPWYQLLFHNGKLLEEGRTLSDYDIRLRTDILHLRTRAVGGKPVIYLFSPREIKARVRLGLVREWGFSAIYPVVPLKSLGVAMPGKVHQSLEWNVETRRNGSMLEKTTGLEVAYLFWEAHTCEDPAPSPPLSPRLNEFTGSKFVPTDAQVTPEDSVLLSIQDLPQYLDKALHALSLHTEARTSFITYWLPSFLKHKYIALRFLPQVEYEAAAPLDITPTPDVVTRIFMLFRGVKHEVVADWKEAVERAAEDHAFWRDVVNVDVDTASDESLFRVLEWGGMEVL